MRAALVHIGASGPPSRLDAASDKARGGRQSGSADVARRAHSMQPSTAIARADKIVCTAARVAIALLCAAAHHQRLCVVAYRHCVSTLHRVHSRASTCCRLVQPQRERRRCATGILRTQKRYMCQCRLRKPASIASAGCCDRRHGEASLHAPCCLHVYIISCCRLTGRERSGNGCVVSIADLELDVRCLHLCSMCAS
jgi:hypothetical protein